jgi:hypothetical protein
MLPKGAYFDAYYFCTDILADVDRICPAATAEDARRNFVLHFDNAFHHLATAIVNFLSLHRMKRAPQPPFSPDLAPSDFYLLGKLKMALTEAEFEDEHQLLDGVMEVLNEVTRDDPESVFEEWVARLDACIQGGGDYVESQESITHSFASFRQSHLRMLNNNGTPCHHILSKQILVVYSRNKKRITVPSMSSVPLERIGKVQSISKKIQIWISE